MHFEYAPGATPINLWKVEQKFKQNPALAPTAFLELMQLRLEGASTSLLTAGATEVVVVPVFFG